jgi:hypothetical protein
MTTYTDRGLGGRTPWHLWVVGGLSLLWNLFGVYDLTMTLSQGEEYLRSMKMTDPQVAYFNAMPAWVYAPWALGVFGAAMGSILLLLRRRWALHAFVLSLVGLLISMVYTFLLSDGGRVMGDANYFQIVILAACLFFVWYAWRMTKRGVLR